MRTVEICFSPALYPYYHSDYSIVVIVDIFRATTTICAAFENGLKSLTTIADIEEAKAIKQQGFLVAAERNVKKVDFADFGNSPFDYTMEKIAGKHLYFTTTNGTQAVERSKNASEILIGAFSNIDALKQHCIRSGKNVLILCSGWNNKFCIEDTIFAGALAQKLLENDDFTSKSDAVTVAISLWNIASKDLITYIRNTEHYERLVKNNLEDAVGFCLTENTTSVVPKYNKEHNIFEL